ncbi:DUF2905 domain-containing protein [Marinitoga aeolica]|uniref:DUF2905 domain-containing protein n=1 Tax=Marinitoga aeolica TaxID=2809031 RepID=A0ABY8PNP0_9BACT|nr:DUF2905 domain-containing protein [Marinitoga aeolica]WGS64266.1 DUF2905 domain-containing protein [Marinitoga aeolica]
MQELGKYIISIGIVLIIIGLLIYLFDKIPFKIGRLPGDILIKKENFTFYFPLTSAILISVILNVIILIIRKIK